MKEDMFEVLMYLFEKHMSNNCKLHLNEDLLTMELEKAGFQLAAINRALDWLEGLLIAQENIAIVPANDAIRLYTEEEQQKLGPEILGLLFSLHQIGVLNIATQELVIDRLMDIEEQDINLPQVKWITLLVLFNQPNEEVALACMESLVLEWLH